AVSAHQAGEAHADLGGDELQVRSSLVAGQWTSTSDMFVQIGLEVGGRPGVVAAFAVTEPGSVVPPALVGIEDVWGELVDEPQRPGDQWPEDGFGDAVGRVLLGTLAA